jgi:hypothetical protein
MVVKYCHSSLYTLFFDYLLERSLKIKKVRFKSHAILISVYIQKVMDTGNKPRTPCNISPEVNPMPGRD